MSATPLLPWVVKEESIITIIILIVHVVNEIITSCLHAEKEIINVFKKIILVEQQKDKDSQMHNILYQQCLYYLIIKQ